VAGSDARPTARPDRAVMVVMRGIAYTRIIHADRRRSYYCRHVLSPNFAGRLAKNESRLCGCRDGRMGRYGHGLGIDDSSGFFNSDENRPAAAS